MGVNGSRGRGANLAVVCLARFQQLLSPPSQTPSARHFLQSRQAHRVRPPVAGPSCRDLWAARETRAQWETRNLALYTLIWFLPVDYPTLYCKRRLVWWIMERIYPSKPWGEGEGLPGPGQASSAPAHMAASVNGPPGRGLGRRGARGVKFPWGTRRAAATKHQNLKGFF